MYKQMSNTDSSKWIDYTDTVAAGDSKNWGGQKENQPTVSC